MTHYEVLGVARDASPADIRSAFRRLVRAHHPDTDAAATVDQLVPISEAWRVLGDPARRREYDNSLDRVASPASAVQVRVVEPPPPPSSFPWRFLAGMAAVGITIVVLGVITYEPSPPGPPDRLLEPGSCVVIEDNGDAAEVNCDADHDGVVDALVETASKCVVPLEPHRDRQGLGVACIRFDV